MVGKKGKESPKKASTPAKKAKAPAKPAKSPAKAAKAPAKKEKVAPDEDPDAGIDEAFEKSESNKQCVTGTSKVREKLDKKKK